LSGKPVAEQEIGNALLQEMVAFAETFYVAVLENLF